MMTPSPTKQPPWVSHILAAQRALFLYHCPDLKFVEHRIPVSTNASNETSSINMVMASQPSTTATGVLVLLHGWGAGLAVFSRTLPHLTSRFKAVYLVDVPGMGASSREPFPRKGTVEDSLSYFLPSLDRLYAALSHDNIFRSASYRHLGAHSLGAYISVEWLLTKQETLFDSVVLVSPVGVPERPEQSQRRGLVAASFSALWRSGVTPQAALRALPSPLARSMCRGYISTRYTANLSDAETELLTEYYLRVSTAPGASERSMATLLEPGAWAKVPLIKRLGGLEGAVAFVYGDRDWMDWRMGERARQEMSGPTRLFRVRDADHNVFVDNPEGFASACAVACGAVEGGGGVFEDGSFELEVIAGVTGGRLGVSEDE